MGNKYPGYWQGIAVHNGDPMTVADNDNDHDIKEYIVVAENKYLGSSYDDAFFDIKKKFEFYSYNILRLIFLRIFQNTSLKVF